jgi:hypothetical protein
MANDLRSQLRGSVLTLSGFLLSLFSSRLPDYAQNLGLIAGVALGLFGLGDIAIRWVLQKPWFNNLWSKAVSYGRGDTIITATRPAGAADDVPWVAQVEWPKHRLSRELIVAFFVTFALSGVLYGITQYFTGPNPDTFSPANETSRRVFARDSIGELVGIYQGKTGLEADQIFETKRGKWIAVTGKIHDISAFYNGTVYVSLSHSFFTNIYVSLIFRPMWKPKFEEMRANDSIRAYCQIHNASENSLALENCELA